MSKSQVDFLNLEITTKCIHCVHLLQQCRSHRLPAAMTRVVLGETEPTSHSTAQLNDSSNETKPSLLSVHSLWFHRWTVSVYKTAWFYVTHCNTHVLYITWKSMNTVFVCKPRSKRCSFLNTWLSTLCTTNTSIPEHIFIIEKEKCIFLDQLALLVSAAS